ncbi:MAG: DUF72 domain-containing protein [Anaerolineae bacterium]|nr:DUF72 domain-containing protein [Anaerolineae bacterium]
MIYIGTSGYSYDDWVGPYYPPDLPKKEWLSFYAREFNASELNFTYYRLPNAWTLERIAAKTGEGFQFTVKAYKGMTHEREDNTEAFTQFVAALRPLLEANKLGCILLQFPYSFQPAAEHFDYLRRCRDLLQDLPLVVEFRRADWLSEETFAFLREHDLGFCCVDEPRLKGLIPPVARVTGPVAYVRFHGRNAKKWWQHEHAWERYDYTYSKEELQEWVPKLRQMDQEAVKTFAFANNHWQAQAIDTARQLQMLLQ